MEGTIEGEEEGEIITGRGGGRESRSMNSHVTLFPVSRKKQQVPPN